MEIDGGPARSQKKMMRSLGIAGSPIEALEGVIGEQDDMGRSGGQ
jgi:hypothetical protein